MIPSRPWYILPVIVVAQFAGTSLWFAGNAVLAGNTALSAASLTAAVQAGFIAGTLLFALLALPDKMAPALLFLLSALIGAAANAAISLWLDNSGIVLTLRLITGFCLAGIYPVGMKIAADWFPEGLGKALGWLVGALVLGTAFPHLMRASLAASPPAQLLFLISVLAASGGLLLFFTVPTRQGLRSSLAFQPGLLLKIIKEKGFRSAALGYLGHMWELYTFWAFLPSIILWHSDKGYALYASPSFLSFLVIGIGAIGCIGGGYLSKSWGSAKVSQWALMISGSCCLLLPLFGNMPFPIFLLFLLIWGFNVVADSPQLSALAAQTAPNHLKGAALTLLTSAGFALTVCSLMLIEYLATRFGMVAMIILAPGPVLAVFSLLPLRRINQPNRS